MNFNLIFVIGHFVMLMFEHSAESASPDAGCSLSSAGRKRCTRRVDTETLAAGHLQDNFPSDMRQHSLFIMHKASSCDIFHWLLRPLQQSKNIWHLKIGCILNHCKHHLFSKQQLGGKNNLGLKLCMVLPCKISRVGFVTFAFLEVWGKGCLMATKWKESCGTGGYGSQTCREVVPWRLALGSNFGI